MIIFTVIFSLLGLIAPLIDAEISNIEAQTSNSIDIGESISLEIETVLGVPIEVLSIIGNFFALPFWTFGLPIWVNLWILAPFRSIYIFIIARNIWVGGGG